MPLPSYTPNALMGTGDGTASAAPPNNDLMQWFRNTLGTDAAAQTRAALAQQAQQPQSQPNWSGAAQGMKVYDPTTGQLTPHGQQMAGLVAGFAGGPSPAGAEIDTAAPIAMASKNPRMYNPPTNLAERPFEADYATQPASGVDGRLAVDIEGRPLTAPYVAGRTVLGAADSAIAPAQLDGITEGITGQAAQGVASRELGGNAGLYRRGPDGSQVLYDQGLAPQNVPMVVGHEVGHAIDEAAGQIPTTGLNAELKTLYNTQNNPQSYGKPFTPQNAGYAAKEVPREQMAEAIRAYMTDPNYMKTVAPQTAAAIRAAVNSNPFLSRTIQFNTLAPLGAVGLGGAMMPQQNALMSQQGG